MRPNTVIAIVLLAFVALSAFKCDVTPAGTKIGPDGSDGGSQTGGATP